MSISYFEEISFNWLLLAEYGFFQDSAVVFFSAFRQGYKKQPGSGPVRLWAGSGFVLNEYGYETL